MRNYIRLIIFISSVFYSPPTLKSQVVVPEIQDLSILLQSIKTSADSLKIQRLLTDLRPGTLYDSLTVLNTGIKLIEVTEGFQDQKWLAHAAQNHGRNFSAWGMIDSAAHYFNKALTIFEKRNLQSNLAEIYLDLENNSKMAADYSSSVNYNFAALAIFEQMDDQIGIAKCYTRLCDLLYYQAEYRQGADYCKQAISILEQMNAPDDLAVSYRYLADNELFIEDVTDKGLASINKAIAVLREAGKAEAELIRPNNTKGNIFKYLKRYEEAMAVYQKNYSLASDAGDISQLLIAIGNMGHLYRIQAKYKEAIPYFREAIDLMIKTGSTSNLWENYMHLSECLKETGQFEQALHYHALYANEIFDQKQSLIDGLESELQIKYETAKKNETIKFQEAKIDQQRKIQLLYLSIALLLLLILTGVFYTYRNNKKKNQKLKQLNKELDIKNQQNVLLLREIHHRVKNNLEIVRGLISLQSAQLDNSKTKDALLASQNRVQSMGIIHQKLYAGENPGAVEMKNYFINLGEGILDSFGVDDRIKVKCEMNELELDIDTAVPIGLIVNELMMNSLKYAFPDDRNGEIMLKMVQEENNTMSLLVKDDGIGIQENQQANGTGFGTQLINLLTRQLNGTMEINTMNGTAVSFKFKTDK